MNKERKDHFFGGSIRLTPKSKEVISEKARQTFARLKRKRSK